MWKDGGKGKRKEKGWKRRDVLGELFLRIGVAVGGSRHKKLHA